MGAYLFAGGRKSIHVTSTGARFHRLCAGLTTGLALACAGAAEAASVYAVSVTTPDLGIITAAASGDTVFRIDPATGSITRISGTGVRSSSSPQRAMVTVTCSDGGGGGSPCSKTVNVQFAVVGSAIGRARSLTRLTFAMGTAVLFGPPPPPASGTFVLQPIGLGASKTFFIGGDFTIGGDDSGLPSGHAESDFSVAVSEGTPTAGVNGGYQATVIRGLSIAKTSDLVFGTVTKPIAGAGAVAISEVDGSRDVSGGVVAFSSPTPSRATFNVTGEGGQAISVTVPATFSMTGPQTITVTTRNSATGAVSLSNTLGVQGTYSFGVGGSAPVTSTTPDGAYSGNFTVTVSYN